MPRPWQRVLEDRLHPPRSRRHHHDPIREDQCLVDAVGDEHDGLAAGFLDAQQLLLHLLARHRVQRRKWLVHQQHLGVGGQDARQSDTLLHAS